MPDFLMKSLNHPSSAPKVNAYLHRPCHDINSDEQFASFSNWLGETANVDLIEKPYFDKCCGFGGIFSTRFSTTAQDLMEHRLGAIAPQSRLVISAEPGCLSHFAEFTKDVQVAPLATFLLGRFS